LWESHEDDGDGKAVVAHGTGPGAHETALINATRGILYAGVYPAACRASELHYQLDPLHFDSLRTFFFFLFAVCYCLILHAPARSGW
jgi:hypothetical protein